MYKTLTVAALIGMSAASFAGDQMAKQSATPGEKMNFDQLDADRDGSITRVEAEKSEWLKNRFETGDKNADERLDKTEFDALKG